MAGAPEGNKNSSKSNRLWAETIRRAVLASDAEKLRAIADKLIEKAAEGDIQAIKELGDRLDGKAQQSLDANLSGNVVVEIVRYADTPAE
jgi:hypothetical protein